MNGKRSDTQKIEKNTFGAYKETTKGSNLVQRR